jgi:hypothetical protein
MDYKEAYTQFSTAFAQMQEQLQNWVAQNGGTFDDEGYVTGLSENNMIHYEKRNAQLVAMLEYVEAVEAERKEKIAEVTRLKTKIKLLETAERAEKYTDEYVLQEVQFFKNWTIDNETTLDDLRQILKETVFFIELAYKRHLIEPDEVLNKKLINSKALLKDDRELRGAYFFKKEKLKEAEKSTVLDEYTESLAKPA